MFTFFAVWLFPYKVIVFAKKAPVMIIRMKLCIDRQNKKPPMVITKNDVNKRMISLATSMNKMI